MSFFQIGKAKRKDKASPNKWRAYTSRLQKGGALFEDMRLLIRGWRDDISRDRQFTQVMLGNLLGKRSRARAADVYKECFYPRFLKGDPPQAWKIVRPLEDRRISIEILKPIYYWITARSEPLLYDFVLEDLLPRSKGLDQSIRTEETRKWILFKLSQMEQSWSESVTIRVAQAFLATLRDFAILQGIRSKKIAPIYLPIESFAYLAFNLHVLGYSGEKLIFHPDWKLFLMDSPLVERLFLEAHQDRLLHYQAAGKIHRIEFYAHTLEEMADVILRKSA